MMMKRAIQFNGSLANVATISNAILKLVNKIAPNKQYTASWYKQTMNNKALPLN